MEAIEALEALEALAAVAGAAYILLAIRQHRACWIAGGVSSALYIVVFQGTGAPQQAALQVVFIALAVQGWFAWRADADAAAALRRMRPRGWLLALAVVGAGTAVNTTLFARYGWSAAPFAESLCTWASIVATWMVLRRIVESWPCWVAIDLGQAALFASLGLSWQTVALFLAYAGLALVAWRSWSRTLAAA